jgi:hypothetical protein
MSNKAQFQKQSTFSEKDIKDRLKGFSLVEEYDELKLGMSIRYFRIDPDSKEKQFRMGGIITFIDPDKRFIQLKNPTANLRNLKPFSVQLNGMNELYMKDLPQEKKHLNDIVDSLGGIDNLEYLNQLISDIGGFSKFKKLFNLKHPEDMDFDKLITQGGLDIVFELMAAKSLKTIKTNIKKSPKEKK